MTEDTTFDTDLPQILPFTNPKGQKKWNKKQKKAAKAAAKQAQKAAKQDAKIQSKAAKSAKGFLSDIPGAAFVAPPSPGSLDSPSEIEAGTPKKIPWLLIAGAGAVAFFLIRRKSRAK